MKILILGQGLLGSELKKVFANQEPICLDINNLDITDFEKTKKEIFKIKPNVIFNAAAYTNVEKAQEEKELCFKVNAQAVKNLAQISKQIKAKFFHFSTDYVFDGLKKEGYLEDDIPKNPLNVYGQSKLAGENYIRAISNDFKIPNFYLIRTSYIFGPGGKNFVLTMINLAQTLPEIKVVFDQFACVTYAPDLAKATKELLENKNFSGGIFHRTNDGVINFFDYAKEIFKIKKELDGNFNIPKLIPIKLKDYPSKAPRPQYSILLNTKLPLLRNYQLALREYLKCFNK
jgi:dTDP-4-dehydrorhamnose reductase